MGRGAVHKEQGTGDGVGDLPRLSDEVAGEVRQAGTRGSGRGRLKDWHP